MPDFLTHEANDAIREAQARTGLSRTEVINRALIAYGRSAVDTSAVDRAKPVHTGVLTTVARWRFYRAYKVLRTVAERHRTRGHEVDFVAVNEGLIRLNCLTCTPGGGA